VEQEDARLSLQRTALVRDRPELLGQLVVALDPAAGFYAERNETRTPERRAGAGRDIDAEVAEKTRAVATVDVADRQIVPDRFVVALQMPVIGRVVGGEHPVVAVLKLRGGAKRHLIIDGKIDHALEVGGVVGTVGQAGIARELTDDRLGGFELDDPSGRIAPE